MQIKWHLKHLNLNNENENIKDNICASKKETIHVKVSQSYKNDNLQYVVINNQTNKKNLENITKNIYTMHYKTLINKTMLMKD